MIDALLSCSALRGFVILYRAFVAASTVYALQNAAAAISTADVLAFVRVSLACLKLFITIIRNGSLKKKNMCICVFPVSLCGSVFMLDY